MPRKYPGRRQHSLAQGSPHGCAIRLSRARLSQAVVISEAISRGCSRIGFLMWLFHMTDRSRFAPRLCNAALQRGCQRSLSEAFKQVVKHISQHTNKALNTDTYLNTNTARKQALKRGFQARLSSMAHLCCTDSRRTGLSPKEDFPSRLPHTVFVRSALSCSCLTLGNYL